MSYRVLSTVLPVTRRITWTHWNVSLDSWKAVYRQSMQNTRIKFSKPWNTSDSQCSNHLKPCFRQTRIVLSALVQNHSDFLCKRYSLFVGVWPVSEFEPDLRRLPFGALKVGWLGPTSKFSLLLTAWTDICNDTKCVRENARLKKAEGKLWIKKFLPRLEVVVVSVSSTPDNKESAHTDGPADVD